jgi:hypothetical protein
MSLLDLFFSDFKWYRRRSGGTWYYINTHSDAGFQGSLFIWVREPGPNDKIVKKETY